ncbi:MAG: hypothetical protein H0V01_04680 [Bacteroidetes bacterium]|nr:hypothetical protein [Bacteroidota bacterium]HET6244857.1 DUF6340 family protein [Bacteroidia bacterium]
MKADYLKVIFFLVLLIILQSCTTSLRISVLQPADINMPHHFEKLAVVHRHKPSQENILTSVLDGILSGGVGLLTDKEAGKSCLNGLKDALLKTPRYIITEPAGLDLRGTGTGVFAAPLSWEQIEKICIENGAEALIVLEVFDTKSVLSFTTGTRKVTNKEGVSTDVIEQVANLRMMVTAGWRIYDYQNKRIVDEFRGESYLDFGGRGTTQQLATAALINGRDAINKAAFNAGSVYGYRISPQWVWVHREYYTKGSPSLKIAGRMARTQDWDAAREIWLKLSRSQDKKIARRSTHNMAIGYEVAGQLEEALEWSKKSYTQFNNKKSLRHSHQIRARISDNERLKQQMQ